MLNYDGLSFVPNPIDWTKILESHPNATIDDEKTRCVLRYPDGIYEIEMAYKIHYNDEQ